MSVFTLTYLTVSVHTKSYSFKLYSNVGSSNTLHTLYITNTDYEKFQFSATVQFFPVKTIQTNIFIIFKCLLHFGNNTPHFYMYFHIFMCTCFYATYSKML